MKNTAIAQIVPIQKKYQLKEEAFQRDSTKLSEKERASRREELQLIQSEFLVTALFLEDGINIQDSLFRLEETTYIQQAAQAVATKKGYGKVYEHADTEVVRVNAPTGVKMIDITELVMKEMNLK